MKLRLNGESVEARPASSLAELLDAQGFGDAKVATAVNGAFVPAAARAGHVLQENDMIEVLAPMQGG